MDARKQLLEKRDSGISCVTPSPPPKKSPLPRPPGGSARSPQKELRHRIPSRENLDQNVAHDQGLVQNKEEIEMPPKLDLSSIINDESENDMYSSEAVSTDRTGISEGSYHVHPELALGVDTPSTGSSDQGINPGLGLPDGYQTDVECSSSSPAPSSSASPSSLGHGDLRRYGSGELEDESEGNVMKVRLKLKSSRPRTGSGGCKRDLTTADGRGSHRPTNSAGSDGRQTRQHEQSNDGTMFGKYAPLPGIGQPVSDQIVTDTGDQKKSEHHSLNKQVMGSVQESAQSDQDIIREQRLRALERSASQTETNAGRKFPTPPPQSAKTVSRRAMRMQQFARRKSASQAEAASRQSTRTSSQASDTSKAMLLAIRLPNGTRVQNLFSSSECLHGIAQFALEKGNCPLEVGNVCLVTNDLPKREFRDLGVTVEEAEISDRTLLHLEELG